MKSQNRVDWTKDQLEAERIRRELATPWIWRNIQTIVTCIVAVLGVIYAAKTDLFEVQKQRMQLEVEVFTARRDSLHRENGELFARNQTLLIEREQLIAERRRQDSLLLKATVSAKRAQAALLPVSEQANFLQQAIREAEEKYITEQVKVEQQSGALMVQQYTYEKQLSMCAAKVFELEESVQFFQELTKRLRALSIVPEKLRKENGLLTVGDLEEYETLRRIDELDRKRAAEVGVEEPK